MMETDGSSFVIPVYVIHIVLSLSLAMFTTAFVFAILSSFRKRAARLKVKRDLWEVKQARLKVEREEEKQKNIRNKREELESMLPPAWLEAYDICKNLDAKEIRFIWLEAFFDRAIGAQPSMPFLSIEAAAKFAEMISGWSGGNYFRTVLRMFGPYFQLEAIAICVANADDLHESEWMDAIAPDGWQGQVRRNKK